MLYEISTGKPGNSQEQAAILRREAERCRRLAVAANDKQAMDALTRLAAEWEAKSREFDNRK